MNYPYDPYDRIDLGRDSSGRPLVVNARTLAMLKKAEKILGHKLTIVQGSYRAGNGASASAGTHDEGGVIDIRTWDIPSTSSVERVTRVLRDVGFAAWYRTSSQGFDPHIHAVAIGDAELQYLAADQVTSYRNGRTGLASNGYDPQPYRPNPIPVFNYRRWWLSIVPKQDISLELVRKEALAFVNSQPVKARVPVKRLQRALNAKYKLGLAVDGIWGEVTADAYGHHERKVGAVDRPRVPDDFTLPKLLRGTRYRMK